MPVLRQRRNMHCAHHGDDCALGGGSSYRSAYCARLTPSDWTPTAEDVELVAEARAKLAGVTLAGALAGQDAEAKRWARLTPVQRCKVRDGQDAELAALIGRARAEEAAGKSTG